MKQNINIKVIPEVEIKVHIPKQNEETKEDKSETTKNNEN